MQYIHTMNEILSSLKNDGNFAIGNNRDGPWGHDTKWNKPDTERQVLMIPFVWDSWNSPIHKLKG